MNIFNTLGYSCGLQEVKVKEGVGAWRSTCPYKVESRRPFRHLMGSVSEYQCRRARLTTISLKRQICHSDDWLPGK